MTDAFLLSDLIPHAADRAPDTTALTFTKQSISYAELALAQRNFANGVIGLGLQRGERIAIYLEKRFETVIASFGAPAAGCVFVPLNPLLKPEQVAYIMRDCNVRMLVTSPERYALLTESLATCHDLRHVVLLNHDASKSAPGTFPVIGWRELLAMPERAGHRVIDTDMTAILYTSGSTGRPKGVVLSHRNMVTGARSVAEYLENVPEDRLLAVLPFSFDYGFSQLTTAFSVGASVSLMDYLLPRDVVKAVARDRITGLAAVPPLWVQLAPLDWPAEAVESLRYLTNSGGAMPTQVTARLRRALPRTRVFLMYGLTEAFRSTYLPPEELDRRPESMGRAIPNAEILVVREDGSPCAPGEPGELVHRGSLVAMGYWNDPERTAERFKPAPGRPPEVPLTEMAVWSGDTVRTDEDGFLYFVGRRDEMIKTSGYRVSPTEVEEVLYGSGLVAEAAALGLPHPALGQGIVAVVKPRDPAFDPEALLAACKRELPNFMVPLQVVIQDTLPRNPNGKVDRRALVEGLRGLWEEK